MKTIGEVTKVYGMSVMQFAKKVGYSHAALYDLISDTATRIPKPEKMIFMINTMKAMNKEQNFRDLDRLEKKKRAREEAVQFILQKFIEKRGEPK